MLWLPEGKCCLQHQNCRNHPGTLKKYYFLVIPNRLVITIVSRKVTFFFKNFFYGNLIRRLLRLHASNDIMESRVIIALYFCLENWSKDSQVLEQFYLEEEVCPCLLILHFGSWQSVRWSSPPYPLTKQNISFSILPFN